MNEIKVTYNQKYGQQQKTKHPDVKEAAKMNQKLNSDLVRLYLSKNLWIHPTDKSIYQFTNGNFEFIYQITDEYFLANIFKSHETEAIFYKVYDKLVSGTLRPFISIGRDEFEVSELNVGFGFDDKLVLKKNNVEVLVFYRYNI